MARTSRIGQLIRAGAVAVAVGALAVVVPSGTAQADEIRDMQWYLEHLHMDAAWDISEGAGTTVAVLDTGVDGSHPDFGDAVAAGIDLTGGDGTGEMDPHGTAMAGLIGARGRGDDGIRGIAPATTILPVTVNSGATIAEGLRWATDHGADVINVSGGTQFEDDPVVREATAYALSHDVVVVAAAGNGGSPGLDFPAGYGGVISVSASTEDDQLTDQSSYGPEVDLAAPGDVVSLSPNGAYFETSGGTSSATAIVSGVVALVRSEFPDLDAANVVNRMIATGQDLGAAGKDDKFGYGLVDPVAALTADVPAVDENPLGSPDGGGGSAGEPSEPQASEPATQPPPSGADPCATESESAPGPAGPAGALRLGTDCGGFVGVSPGSSNDALGVVVAVGAAVLILIGVAVFLFRRRRSAPPAQPVPAYGGTPAPPPHLQGSAPSPGGWQAPPPATGGPTGSPTGSPTGEWPGPPPPAGPPTGGWQAPPGAGPPSR